MKYGIWIREVSFDALRLKEAAKTKCGQKHFEALGNVLFKETDNFEDFIEDQVVL